MVIYMLCIVLQYVVHFVKAAMICAKDLSQCL